MRYLFSAFLVLFICRAALSGQGSLLPLGSLEEAILDRLEISTGKPAPVHSSLKPYARGPVMAYALALDSAQSLLSTLDKEDLRLVFLGNNEWLGALPYPTTLGEKSGRKSGEEDAPSLIESAQTSPLYFRSRKPILKYFYPTPANLLEVNTPAFHLRVNPLFQLKYGRQQNNDEPYFLNQRGVELRAGIDERIFVSMNIVENQAQFPAYVRDRYNQTRSLPGAGLVKNYTGFGVQNGYDFLLSQGYVGFNFTRHVGAQFGYGRNFIGNGYRSVLLSDFSFNYLHLKLNWQVWKLHFQNIFGELNSSSANATPGEKIVPKKYFAAHHLSINLTPKLNIGLFEAVVFNRENHFEFQYLNPVVFYRTVEHGLGSPDNVLIGLDGKWNFLNRFQLYGQFMLDEFKFNELFVEKRGWWANKYAYQAGAKYINAFGIDHLDLQAEYNRARPFIYTHFQESSAYTHYRQPLAHPLGANFSEWVLLGRWQILPRLLAQGRLILASTGEDAQGSNWGTNLLLSSDTRTQDYDNEIGQGVGADIQILGLDLSYRIAHQTFLDLQLFSRKKTSDDPNRSSTQGFLGGGIRMNLGQWRNDY